MPMTENGQQLDLFADQNNGFGNTKTGERKKTIIPRVIPSPAKVFTTNIGRGRAPTLRWESPEWDLAECGRILDTESYVRRAFKNKRNLFLKEGYSFVGAKPERIQYIKQRFKQMETATDVPFKILFAQTIASLIRTSNAFWVKVRNDKASGGRIRTTANGKSLKPVAGYFSIPPETIRFKRDEYGKITKYVQEVYGKEAKEFAPENIIHFYFDKREGFSVGTPSLVPVKDDIRALRRIEENLELLINQHLFPLFHYQVGTENKPADVHPDGTTEVDDVEAKIAAMPSDGCWVTSERHKITPISAKGSPVAADKVIAHYKQRIFTGLGNSSVDMGEGDTANRCFDRETEILTDSGWKYYWEYKDGDKIGTIDRDTHKLQFREPKDGLLLYDYDGELCSIKNRYVDLAITPNHKLYFGNIGWRGKLTWELKEVQDIEVKKFALLTSSNGASTYASPSTFSLPQIDYAANITGHSNLGPFPEINMDDWLEFLGYFISEGTVSAGRNRYPVGLSQSQLKNPKKVKKIRSLLQRLPFEYKEYYAKTDQCYRWNINCKSLWHYLSQEIGTYSLNKRIPKEFKRLSHRQTKILLDALVLGDGSYDSRLNRKGFSYSSGSKQLLDDVQELALNIGWRASLGPVHKGVGRVNFHPKTDVEVRSSQVERYFYKGKVWCFEVPNHTLIVRRNGKVSVQGNSTAQTMSRNLIDDTKADQNEFAAQFEHGVIRELMLESTFPDGHMFEEENEVYLRFAEIDFEAKQARENHLVDIFTKNAITHHEMRTGMGYEPFNGTGWVTSKEDGDFSRTFYGLFKRDEVVLQSIDEPGTDASKSEAQSRTKVNVNKSAGGNAISNKNQPENQHGRRASAKVNKDGLLFGHIPSLFSISKEEAPLQRYYDRLISDLMIQISRSGFSLKEVKFLVDSAFSQGKDGVFRLAKQGFRVGLQDFNVDPWEIQLHKADAKIQDHVNKYVDKLYQDVLFHIERNTVKRPDSAITNAMAINAVLATLHSRTGMIDNSEILRAYNYGRVMALRFYDVGLEQLIPIRNNEESCRICDNAILKYSNSNAIIYEKLPPFHPYCTCLMGSKRGVL